MKHTYVRGQASEFAVKRPQGILYYSENLQTINLSFLLIKHQDNSGVIAPHILTPRHWSRRSWTFRPLYLRVGSLLFPSFKAGPIPFLNAAEKKVPCFCPIVNTIHRYSSPQSSHFTDWASVACSLTELCQLQTQQLGIIGLAICWGPHFQAIVQRCKALPSYCRCSPDVQVLPRLR